MWFTQKRCPVSRLLLDLDKQANQFSLLYRWSEWQTYIWLKRQNLGLFFHLCPVFLFHTDKLLGVIKKLSLFKVLGLSGLVLVWLCWRGWGWAVGGLERPVRALAYRHQLLSVIQQQRSCWGIEIILCAGLEVLAEYQGGSAPWGKCSHLRCVVEHPAKMGRSSRTIPLQLTMWWRTRTPRFTFSFILVSSEKVTGDQFICH